MTDDQRSDYDEDELDQRAYGNATQEQFNEWVREYVRLDGDISESNKAIADLRKLKKELQDKIKIWMQHNNVSRVNTARGILQRTRQERTKPLSLSYVQERLAEVLEDEDKAAHLADMIYDGRPIEEIDTLSLKQPASKKRRRGR